MSTTLLTPQSKVLYIKTNKDVQIALEQWKKYDGPVALDTERAGSYRYDDRAYLIQMKLHDSPIYLIDPVELSEDSLEEIAYFLNHQEWILHASTQDLPCLIALGMRPDRLFDTELAARLLNYPKVGLSSLTHDMLGIDLAKSHSNVDWSRRPLNTSWLAYAALDVELLHALREKIITELNSSQKQEIARQEFDYYARIELPEPREEPWRKMHGIGNLKNQRQLAIARDIWTVRDKIARNRDRAPHLLLKDRQIVTLAIEQPRSVPQLMELLRIAPHRQREAARWLGAIYQGLRAENLPERRVKGNGIPPTSFWRDRNELNFRRFKTARILLEEHAQELNIPAENLISPATIREILWNAPNDASQYSVAIALDASDARPWQKAEISALLEEAIASPRPLEDFEQEQE